MSSGDFLTGIQGLVMWVGNLVLPALAALALVLGIYAYSQRRSGERYLTAAVLCLLGPAVVQLIAAFVTRTPASGGHDQYYNGIVNAVNWIGNVIMPMFAVLNFVRGIIALGGVFENFNIGDDWARYFLVGLGSLTVSGVIRLFEHFVLTSPSSLTFLNLPVYFHGGALCLFA